MPYTVGRYTSSTLSIHSCIVSGDYTSRWSRIVPARTAVWFWASLSIISLMPSVSIRPRFRPHYASTWREILARRRKAATPVLYSDGHVQKMKIWANISDSLPIGIGTWQCVCKGSLLANIMCNDLSYHIADNLNGLRMHCIKCADDAQIGTTRPRGECLPWNSFGISLGHWPHGSSRMAWRQKLVRQRFLSVVTVGTWAEFLSQCGSSSCANKLLTKMLQGM